MGMLSEIIYFATLLAIRFVKGVEKLLLKIYPKYAERIWRIGARKAGFGFGNKNPYDIQVKNKNFFVDTTNKGMLGMGECYMNGDWDCDDLVELFRIIWASGFYKRYYNTWNNFIIRLEMQYFNLQTKTKAWEVGEKHYNLGNDLFESFLDPAMNYSCGYWRKAKDLTEAQFDKMDLIAKKLDLKAGQRVLDIGCGWGGLCHHLAKNYGVSVVGITISEEQAKLAEERCKGLPVEIKLVDYRDLDEKFDRIVSVGMFEHVGHNNYREFFETAHRCLEDDGIFLLHTIGTNHHDIPVGDPFFHTYIFPNGILPYYKHITEHTEKLFVIEDWQNFGHDYSRTLMAWRENFVKNWPSIEQNYNKKFYRMWDYYLQFCSGCFLSRKYQLWQVVLSKDGIKGGYYAPR